ncbi:pyridoxal phosphate-dependent transferase [Trichophaea hybrida]|nr:pyridoxal phosphate-dependent transferase [Trichophaea hybrida]
MPLTMDPVRESTLQRILPNGYNLNVEEARNVEYPQLKDCTYLDHGGTTLYARSAIEAFTADLCSNLYGNPHSPSAPSEVSTKRVENVRLRVLHYFNANPEDFDVVFCANATAGMKLVMEAFSALNLGFRYRYHGDSHTSLVGIRALSSNPQCLMSDWDVEQWLDGPSEMRDIGLFAWPGQSNLSGRRLPLNWAGKLRTTHPNYYSLLDAAALLTTAPLDLSDVSTAPDFTVLSFYKIFGFPDMGALIVRRGSSGILEKRRYFGGGTVDALAIETNFVAYKRDVPHSYLEDGTIPFHSIIALDTMMTTHEHLYGTPYDISRHALSLGRLVYELLSNLKHGNGRNICKFYGGGNYSSSLSQGPTMAFNLQRSDGTWVGYAEFEKLASVKKIYLRVGSMCNPGGLNAYIGLRSWEIEQNYAAGHVCSDDNDIMGGKPTGAIRISLGAMSTIDDVFAFVRFLEEFYVDKEVVGLDLGKATDIQSGALVESLTIYPIKSCGGFKIPAGVSWEIRPHGLAWDREWCLVHLGTGAALSQKAYNKMTTLRPVINLDTGMLVVSIHKSPETPPLLIPLMDSPINLASLHSSASRVCGDRIIALTYNSPEITGFFSTVVGVPCTLARLPAESTSRNYKPHLRKNGPPKKKTQEPKILLSNESPILIINMNSVDALNQQIGHTNGKQTKVDVFRANIVLRDTTEKKPYAEDTWHRIKIGSEYFQLLGPCRRCHMVCIDQDTAEKDEEPYVTLAKTRQIEGKILFGQHATHIANASVSEVPTIRVGDTVDICEDEDEVAVDHEPSLGPSQVEMKMEAPKRERFLGPGGDGGTTIFGDLGSVGLWFMGIVWRW